MSQIPGVCSHFYFEDGGQSQGPGGQRLTRGRFLLAGARILASQDCMTGVILSPVCPGWFVLPEQESLPRAGLF